MRNNFIFCVSMKRVLEQKKSKDDYNEKIVSGFFLK